MPQLTAEQAAAVRAAGRPNVAVVAGAGSGKTEVLAMRAMHLMRRGVAAETILMLTFSRRSALEMEQRVRKHMGEQSWHRAHPEISTFHAWGATVVRAFHAEVGRTHAFSIYDDVDAEELLRRCGAEVGIRNPRSCRLGTILRNEAATRMYRRRLDEADAVDFRLLERLTLRVLREASSSMAYAHVLVDEGQDKSRGQWDILNELSLGGQRPLFVVGDVRQCVYSWRAALPQMFQAYSKSATVESRQLLTNWRSAPQVVEFANGILPQHEPMQARPHALGSERCVTLAAGEPGLAAHTARMWWSCGDSVAVLARTWRELALVRDELRREPGLHYHGPDQDPWSTHDGRNLARLLVLLGSPHDNNLAVMVADWLGDGAFRESRARAHGLRQRRPVIQIVCEPGEWWEDERVPPALAQWLPSWLDAATPARPSEVARALGQERFIPLLESEQLTDIEAFRNWWAFGRRDQDRASRQEHGLHLMTVHAAKGLEFDHVVVLGCDSTWTHQQKERREELDRMAYVAVTRARQSLLLTHSGIKEWAPWVLNSSNCLLSTSTDEARTCVTHAEE